MSSLSFIGVSCTPWTLFMDHIVFWDCPTLIIASATISHICIPVSPYKSASRITGPPLARDFWLTFLFEPLQRSFELLMQKLVEYWQTGSLALKVGMNERTIVYKKAVWHLWACWGPYTSYHRDHSDSAYWIRGYHSGKHNKLADKLWPQQVSKCQWFKESFRLTCVVVRGFRLYTKHLCLLNPILLHVCVFHRTCQELPPSEPVAHRSPCCHPTLRRLIVVLGLGLAWFVAIQ